MTRVFIHATILVLFAFAAKSAAAATLPAYLGDDFTLLRNKYVEDPGNQAITQMSFLYTFDQHECASDTPSFADKVPNSIFPDLRLNAKSQATVKCRTGTGAFANTPITAGFDTATDVAFSSNNNLLTTFPANTLNATIVTTEIMVTVNAVSSDSLDTLYFLNF